MNRSTIQGALAGVLAAGAIGALMCLQAQADPPNLAQPPPPADFVPDVRGIDAPNGEGHEMTCLIEP